MARFLGIDVGTSGCKALLIDGEGRVVGRASASYPLHAPEPTWSEQDPEDWWVAVLACIEEIGERRPDAIGLTGQMHGGVFLDADGAVIRPAILWNDQRTEREAAEIEAAVGSDRIRAITGNPMLTGFQLPKLIWLRKEEPEAYGRLRSLLLPKDYVRYRLTGERRSEPSDLSGTGMFDLVRREWSTEILEALDLDGSLLPEVGESFDFGARTRDAPGLDDGVPVVGGGGDQAAGAVGTGAVEPGIVSVSLGTSGVVFATLAEPKIDPDGRVHTFCHATGGWHAMSVMLSCGGALAWARETWFGGESYVAIEELAAAAPPGAQGLTFLPYLSGERSPHNDPGARGALVGLALGHGREEVARAVFEGVSFGLLDGFEVLRELGVEPEEIRVTGGGARSPLWRQLLADLFERPCHALAVDEGPAYGAALLAAVGAGRFASVGEACRETVRLGEATPPSGTSYAAPYERFRQGYRALRHGLH